MLIDLAAARTAPDGVPAEWAAYITRTATGFRICGDRTAGTEAFLYCAGRSALVATRLDDLLGHLAINGSTPDLDPFGLSALLHHGLVPVPHTEYENIHFLAMGDSAEVTWSDNFPRVSLGYEYPWLVSRSRNDQVPSEETLFRLLTASVQRHVESAGGGFLMLSSGKDSAALALALAECGFTDIPCVTYSSGHGDPEPIVSAELCKRLGLNHQIVEMPSESDETATILTRFFTASARPGTDLAQIPYVIATAAANSPGGAVLDGGGSDSYMSYPVTGSWLSKMRFRIRGRALINFAQKRAAVDSPLNYLARSRPEATLPGRTLRFHETKRFMPNAVDTRPYWDDVAAATSNMNLFDLFGAVSERHAGPAASMKKHVLAAQAIGHEFALPWCDHEVADYYFNLPQEYRYNLETGVGKVLVRSMLLRYLDYDADKIGKHYFAFDGPRFLNENMEFVRSEIDGCTLWDRDNLDLVHGWLDKVASRPLLYHSLLTVFMVSGWHNHSRFVSPATSSAFNELAADG